MFFVCLFSFGELKLKWKHDGSVVNTVSSQQEGSGVVAAGRRSRNKMKQVLS